MSSSVISGILGLLYAGVYSSTTAYEKNKFVADSSGAMWLAIQDVPAGTAPAAGSAYWKKFIDLDEDLNAPTEKVQELGTLTSNTTIDASVGNIASLTVGAAITLALTAGTVSGRCRTLTMFVTNGGAYTITWPTGVKWAGGAAPTLTASGVDVVTFMTVDGGTTWLGAANGVRFA